MTPKNGLLHVATTTALAIGAVVAVVNVVSTADAADMRDNPAPARIGASDDPAPVDVATALRVGTFNIEYYPQTDAQPANAFAAIKALDAPIVAVQEITDEAHFAAQARARLGDDWRAVFAAGDRPLNVGVLFDADRVHLLGVQTHDATVVNGRGLPTFEADFLVDNVRTRLFVVHLKAGGDGGPMRNAQIDGLEPVLRRAVATGDRVVVEGDFNSTGEADRARISKLADDVGLTWDTESLECTCFWERQDGCFPSALDQVLSTSPGQSDVQGECALGCRADRCPSWKHDVSDHCPVVTRF